MPVFEDDFAFLSDKWVKIGDRPNFTVKAEDGWLKIKFDWIIPPETPHYLGRRYIPYNAGGVCYKEPIDLTNRRVVAKFDMNPKTVTPCYAGLFFYCGGLMIGNKVLPEGASLISDPDFKGVLVLYGYLSCIPFESVYYKITGYSYSPWAGRFNAKVPPTELSMEVTPSLIRLYETDFPVGEFEPPFDISKSYIYLLSPQTAEASTQSGRVLGPEELSFDYVKVENLPPPPITPVINTMLYTAIAMSVLISNTTLLIRAVRLVR